MLQTERKSLWLQRLSRHRLRAQAAEIAPRVEGRLTRMVGLTLEAVGCQIPIGGVCSVVGRNGAKTEAEVVGFEGDKLYLMPIGDLRGVVPGAKVIPERHGNEVMIGDHLLGRVVDGAGRPLDEQGPVEGHQRMPLSGTLTNPMQRDPVRKPLDVGVRAINSLFTVGRGQRMGLFAGSGVGKSVLLGMMTKFTEADVVVVGLIGERGREVKEFIETILGEEGMARAVVVAAPADNPPLMRMHGAMLASTVAEYFRDQGKHVLLLMDSLTRYAQAQREVALAVGEPPATKGYPPSVFARLPSLVERAGNGPAGGGSITAFYTVLTEGDDQQDPIADAARAILDGHVVLSRTLAETGLYPAVDIEASISRVMVDITSDQHQLAARNFKQLYSLYRQNQDLISVGAYQRGSDPSIDLAIDYQPKLQEFIRQGIRQPVPYQESVQQLEQLLSPPAQDAPQASSG